MSVTARSGVDWPALQRIVVATDMSAHALRAKNRSAMLAAATGTPLDLVHVVERARLDTLRRIIASEPAGAVDGVLAQAQRSLGERAAELAGRYGIGVQTQLPTGGSGVGRAGAALPAGPDARHHCGAPA